MSDYTPTTEQDDHTLTEAIKKLAVWAACQSDESRGIEEAEKIFDSWLAKRDRKAKAEALEEAAEDFGGGQAVIAWLRDRAQQLTEES